VNYFAVNPGIKLKTDIAGYKVYSTFGVLFAFPKGIMDADLPEMPNWYEFKGPMAFGFMGSVGGEFVIQNLTFFAEANAVSMSWKVTKDINHAPKGTNSKIWTTYEGNMDRRFPLSSIDLEVGMKFGL
jgi:hypothetical protein